jgi:two-component system chemotaxis response regulator CheB
MTGEGPIRAVVIDDSAYSRQAITRMLESSPLVEVVGVARDGEEALHRVFELSPDVVTLDLEMPRMDGFTFLRMVMARRPTPVIVISGRSGEDDVFKALELGAVDFIAKPTPRAAPDLVSIEQQLIRKVHAIRELRIEKVCEHLGAIPPVVRRAPDSASNGPGVVVIGSSTGGPTALMRIFAAFPEAPPSAFLVAQHMPVGFTQGFAERLDRFTPLRAREARSGEPLLPGTVLVAPGGSHLELERQGTRVVTRVFRGGPRDKYVPSVDRLFESAAKHFAADVLAVVLTGMGDDGSRGVAAVKDAGGSVVAESEASAVIFGMPQQAIRTGAVDRVLPLAELPECIRQGVRARLPGTAGEGTRS